MKWKRASMLASYATLFWTFIIGMEAKQIFANSLIENRDVLVNQLYACEEILNFMKTSELRKPLKRNRTSEAANRIKLQLKADIRSEIEMLTKVATRSGQNSLIAFTIDFDRVNFYYHTAANNFSAEIIKERYLTHLSEGISSLKTICSKINKELQTKTEEWLTLKPEIVSNDEYIQRRNSLEQIYAKLASSHLALDAIRKEHAQQQKKYQTCRIVVSR